MKNMNRYIVVFLACASFACIAPAMAEQTAADKIATEGGNGGNILAGFLARQYLERVIPGLLSPKNRDHLTGIEAKFFSTLINDPVPLRAVNPSTLETGKYTDISGKPAMVRAGRLLDDGGREVDQRVVYEGTPSTDEERVKTAVIQFDEVRWNAVTKGGTVLQPVFVDHLVHELFRLGKYRGISVRNDDDYRETRSLNLAVTPADRNMLNHGQPQTLPYMAAAKYGNVLTIGIDEFWGPTITLNSGAFENPQTLDCVGRTIKLQPNANLEHGFGFEGQANCIYTAYKYDTYGYYVASDKKIPFVMEFRVYQLRDSIRFQYKGPDYNVFTQTQISIDWRTADVKPPSYAGVDRSSAYGNFYKAAAESTNNAEQKNLYELHYAAFMGDLNKVQDILLANPNLATSKDWNGKNVLMHSVVSGNAELVTDLIKKYPTLVSGVDVTTLFTNVRYARGNPEETLKALYANAPSMFEKASGLALTAALCVNAKNFVPEMLRFAGKPDFWSDTQVELQRRVTTTMANGLLDIWNCPAATDTSLAANLQKLADGLKTAKDLENVGLFAMLAKDNALFDLVAPRWNPQDENIATIANMTPLLYAAKLDFSYGITSLVNKYKHSITHSQKESTWSPLSVAARFHNLNALKTIVSLWPNDKYDFGYGPSQESLLILGARNDVSSKARKLEMFEWMLDNMKLNLMFNATYEIELRGKFEQSKRSALNWLDCRINLSQGIDSWSRTPEQILNLEGLKSARTKLYEKLKSTGVSMTPTTGYCYTVKNYPNDYK